MTGSFLGFVLRRLALLVLTLLLVPSLSFLMFSVLSAPPGEGGLLVSLAALRDYLAATFLPGALSGDGAGDGTFQRTRGVLELIVEGLPADAYLLTAGLLGGVGIGLVVGSVVALRPHSHASRATHLATAFVLSMPVYWLGFVILILFAPGSGAFEVPFVSTVGAYRPPEQDPIGFVRSLWLPALIVAAPLAAMCARMCTATLGEALHKDFVRTARGKGLRQRTVIRRHALPVAAPAVLGVVGVNMNLMITNVALMEAVFNIPGSFRSFDEALADRDLDLVQGMVMEATVFIVLANFAVDAIQAWLDPRVR